MPAILTRYETLVYPANRTHAEGIRVFVFADDANEAAKKAVAIGWCGHASDAKVVVVRVEQIVLESRGEL